MARTITYRVKTGPGAWQRAVIDELALPQSIPGLVNGTTYQVDTGKGTLVDVTPVAPASFSLLNTFLAPTGGDQALTGGENYIIGSLASAGINRKIIVRVLCMYGDSGAGDPTLASMTIAGVSATRVLGYVNGRYRGVFIFEAIVNSAVSGNIVFALAAGGPVARRVSGQVIEAPTTATVGTPTFVNDTAQNGTATVSQAVAAGSCVLVCGVSRADTATPTRVATWSGNVQSVVSQHYNTPAGGFHQDFGFIPSVSAGTEVITATISGETGNDADYFDSVEITP